MVATDDVCIVYEVAKLEEGLATAVSDVMAGAELDDPTSTVDDKDVLATDVVCIAYEVAELEEGLATTVCDVLTGA